MSKNKPSEQAQPAQQPLRSSREPGELYDKLLEQLWFIDTSARAFDEGHTGEAARLATQIRILVHDKKDKGLLSILGIRNSLKYIGTAIDRDLYTAAQTEHYGAPPIAIAPGEVGFLATLPNDDGSYGFYAPLVEHRYPSNWPQAKATPTLLEFQDWWGAPVIETGKLTYFSREDLITIMANQDGGAHVSEQLNTEFAAFKKDNFGIQAEYQIGGEPMVLDFSKEPKSAGNDPAAASARQIAYELALTLHRYIDMLDQDHPLRVKRKPMYEFMRVLPLNAPPLMRSHVFAGNPKVCSAAPTPAPAVQQDHFAIARSRLRGTYSFDKLRNLK